MSPTSTRRRTGWRDESPRRSPPPRHRRRSWPLARTGYATEPLQYALAHHGIPHRVLGSLGLYERTEVRDALAYLTLLKNPQDAQAFGRAIASSRRGVGAATITRLVTWARDRHRGDLIAATRAKDRLLITHAAERGRRPTGGPSRFPREAGLLVEAASPLAA